jgi:hypothetical protein
MRTIIGTTTPTISVSFGERTKRDATLPINPVTFRIPNDTLKKKKKLKRVTKTNERRIVLTRSSQHDEFQRCHRIYGTSVLQYLSYQKIQCPTHRNHSYCNPKKLYKQQQQQSQKEMEEIKN